MDQKLLKLYGYFLTNIAVTKNIRGVINMKQRFKFCNNQSSLNGTAKLMGGGWELDPRFDAKPIRLENALVFPLVFYNEGEERAIIENKRPGILEDVADVVLVEPKEVAKWYNNGYRVHEIYSTKVAMTKRT